MPQRETLQDANLVRSREHPQSRSKTRLAASQNPLCASGKRGGRRLEGLRVSICEFTAWLIGEFASEIERDPRGFKRQVISAIRTELPPWPGRPAAEIVTRAARMRARGKSWQRIYTECIPTCLIGDSRQLAQSRLRAAIRARVRRKKNKTRARLYGGQSGRTSFVLRAVGRPPSLRPCART
jgi:hypothetical protein